MNESSSTHIVYDDDEIRVIWHPGTSDFVLITFGDLVTPVNGHRYFADAPAHKANMAALGIVAKRGNWYPAQNLLSAYAAAIPFIQDYSVRVSYGGSMGGYAAVKFSALFCATHVIALCPQWSIDPTECEGVAPGWQNYFCSDMSGMGIRANDISGQIFLFLDRLNRLDLFHCRMIVKAYPNAHVINVPFVEHHVTSVFAGTGNLTTLISACRALDLTALYRLSRHTRRKHSFWRTNIAKTAIARFPRIGYGTLAKVAYADNSLLKTNPTYAIGIITHLAVSGRIPGAVKFYYDFRHLCDPVLQLIMCAHLSRIAHTKSILETAHGTAIMYSPIHNTCLHKKFCEEYSEYYVGIEFFGRLAALYVLIADVKFYLSRGERNLISIPSSGHGTVNYFSFEIVPLKDGKFALKDSDFYLSSEPGGKIMCNRNSANRWEHFSLGAYSQTIASS